MLRITTYWRNTWSWYPTQVVEVNSLYRFDQGDIPHNKSASQCLDEFDNFIVKQENFNAYVGRQLKHNAYMI